jgi:hypothetical protein
VKQQMVIFLVICGRFRATTNNLRVHVGNEWAIRYEVISHKSDVIINRLSFDTSDNGTFSKIG